jgi:hypothetical protein
MAPPFRTGPHNPDAWWQMAYHSREDIVVQFELEFGSETITPGTLLKVKNNHGTFKFRCIAHNIHNDKTWFDAIDQRTGEWRSFHLDKIKSIVKPKRSRRKKISA